MYRYLRKIILYKNLEQNEILRELSPVFESFDTNYYEPEEMIPVIYTQVQKILEISTQYGFTGNLWQCFLAYLITFDENPFSLTAEKVGAIDGSVNSFVKSDFVMLRKLFHYDFRHLEEALDIKCFDTITHYTAVEKKEQRYHKSVGDKVKGLSKLIAQAKNEEEIYTIVTNFYRLYGVGKFGMNKAFRVIHEPGQELELRPIRNTDDVRLDNLVGYELQKQKLIENTEAFVGGRTANNCLLFGDSGTGKSTSIKAILNEYYDNGLRMIEIYKHQFRDLSAVIEQVKNRNYRFVIYMDDLSFEDFEIEYKYLKAVIEGGLETRPENVLIYATSNRRHLIRESWSDRSDMTKDELHHSDTMQEKLSLVNRFGVTINFSRPLQKEYFEIVKQLAKRNEIQMPEDILCAEASKWELSHGGLSGRTAQQFINYLMGKE